MHDVVIVEDSEDLISALQQRTHLMRELDTVEALIEVTKQEERAAGKSPQRRKRGTVSAVDVENEEVGTGTQLGWRPSWYLLTGWWGGGYCYCCRYPCRCRYPCIDAAVSCNSFLKGEQPQYVRICAEGMLG